MDMANVLAYPLYPRLALGYAKYDIVEAIAVVGRSKLDDSWWTIRPVDIISICMRN